MAMAEKKRIMSHKKVHHFRVINLLLIISLVILFVGVVSGLSYVNTNLSNRIVAPSSTAFNQLMTHVVIKVPETNFSVSLSAETGKTVAYGDSTKDPYAGYGTVTIVPDYVLNISPKQYAAIVAINSGGSGEAFYLMYFIPKETGFQLTDSVYLGDRIRLEKFTLQKHRLSISFLDHGPDQAMVDAPNVPVTKSFSVTDDKLIVEEN